MISTSRLTITCIIAIASKFVLLMFIAIVRRRRRFADCYTFCYCDGSMRHVISRETVTFDQFVTYDSAVSYPVLHMSDDTIWFLVS